MLHVHKSWSHCCISSRVSLLSSHYLSDMIVVGTTTSVRLPMTRSLMWLLTATRETSGDFIRMWPAVYHSNSALRCFPLTDTGKVFRANGHKTACKTVGLTAMWTYTFGPSTKNNNKTRKPLIKPSAKSHGAWGRIGCQLLASSKLWHLPQSVLLCDVMKASSMTKHSVQYFINNYWGIKRDQVCLFSFRSSYCWDVSR